MATLKASSPSVIDESDQLVPAGQGEKPSDELEALGQWVLKQVDSWRNHRSQNYLSAWEEYERLWRGIWSGSEKLRDSERSKIVTPALSEAVENAAAEIEEATFGRGDYFDINPYATDDPQVREAVEQARLALKEDLGRVDFAANVSECILNAAIYGTGIGEVVVKTIKIKNPVQDPQTGLATATEIEIPVATLRSVNPRNFLIDPNAKNIEEALGVAIEEEVGRHVVLQAQKAGTFRDVEVAHDSADEALQADVLESPYNLDKVHLTRYYGLVPRALLFPGGAATVADLFPQDKIDAEDGEYVEAIVVLGNKRALLKGEECPYIMHDRSVVAFQWDVVPGRFYGRGICEKGANAQKILDAEVRARLDSLALTTVPMMGIDATRVPRGYNMEVRPGKSVLTNGNPQEVLHPFKFGQLDPNHWQNAQSLQAMVHQATGSVDATALAGNVGHARPGAVSMALAPVIKRYKRTMIGFLDKFLMPALEKLVYRNMQYQPERYPAVPMRFAPTSTMGIMQREYEMSQLTSLLATLSPGTPEHRSVLMGIVSNTSIPNREQVLKLIAGAEQREAAVAAQAQQQQQNPLVAQLQQAGIELELMEKRAKIAELQSRAQLNTAKAQETTQMAEVQALQVATKGLYAVPAEQQAAEFDRRVQVTQLALKGADLDEKRADRQSNERIAHRQMTISAMNKERDRQFKAARRTRGP